MSRSGYCDDGDSDGLAMWRGMVASSIRGKRGQKLLRDLADAMDAMPEKVLIADALKTDEGAYCALGVVGAKRGIDIAAIDPEDPEQVSKAFDIAGCLAQEIAYINDEAGPYGKVIDGKWTRCSETPEERWQRVRKWVAEQIKEAK
jgi:hypothetical protein